MSKQVTCIKRRGNHHEPHDRILAMGGENSDGARWAKTEDQAIKEIEGKVESYYVNVKGWNVDIIVSTHKERKYLKTTVDSYSPDKLLSLDDC